MGLFEEPGGAQADEVLVFQRGTVPVALLEPADPRMSKGKKKNVK